MSERARYLAIGCGSCEYEEADGSLVHYCAKCSSEIYQFLTQAALADRPEQPKRVSMGWARLDTAGEIVELNSDEQAGMVEIFRSAQCTCVPVENEHGIGCEMGTITPEDRAKVRACLEKLIPSDRPEPAQHQIRHVNGFYPPSTSIRLQVLGCYATAEYTDIDVQLPCAPQEQAAQVRADWHLNEEQAALLRDTIGEEALPITLSVGPVTDDDGKTETGLRVHLSEYPEEGAILLAAAPALGEGER